MSVTKPRLEESKLKHSPDRDMVSPKEISENKFYPHFENSHKSKLRSDSEESPSKLVSKRILIFNDAFNHDGSRNSRLNQLYDLVSNRN